MRFYLDTEFNGFGGELISLALVPADSEVPTFYRVVEWTQPTVPWVAEHVIPHLGMDPVSRETAARELAAYLNLYGWKTIVADWPTDFEHFLGLLITGPGQMVDVPPFDMEFRRGGFDPATHSRIPHNALEDAIALRNYREQFPKGAIDEW
jgi:hypothetical protein